MHPETKKAWRESANPIKCDTCGVQNGSIRDGKLVYFTDFPLLGIEGTCHKCFISSIPSTPQECLSCCDTTPHIPSRPEGGFMLCSKCGGSKQI
jgi:hypothetical protein